MTSADGHELQSIIEECDIPTRLQMSLELLKKEHAIVSLQRKLGQVCPQTVEVLTGGWVLISKYSLIRFISLELAGIAIFWKCNFLEFLSKIDSV